jgi:ubiquinone/menaquinone biosynthesis C-methylase UbiE
MTTNNADLGVRWLEQYEPQLPTDELIFELNKIYHAFEAQDYNVEHTEIYEQLPPVWQVMIRNAMQKTRQRKWRILDFGCGTGFEAEQLIRELPKGTIDKLTCYDSSPEMLERCRDRISPLFPDALFTCDSRQLQADDEPYNMLATNALLHHLFDPMATINGLLSLLTFDAMWLAGHEPSSRFYENSECLNNLEKYSHEREWRKFMYIDNYLRKFRQILGLQSDPSRQTAKEAFQRGLFRQTPSALAVSRFVDIHVAHSGEEVASGRGFDFKLMQQDLASHWDLMWVKTYSFMGPFYEGSLPRKWGRLCRVLASRFPEDGASFSSVWRRSH